MKHYPTQIFLTVTDPNTGRETMRWYAVNNEQHEKFVRGQVQNARAAIKAARERMAAAVGTDDQKLVVENLHAQFIEFHAKGATNGRMDAARSEPGEARGNEGQLHADSPEARADSSRGSGSGQTQGRESGQESSDGAGIRESSGEPIAVETN